MTAASTTIVALAGRRVDAPDAKPSRFPLDGVPIVRERLRRLLTELDAGLIVCSAACGADLAALAEAGELGIRRRVVLPFAETRFRQTSVVDRPGDWGPLFDRVIAEVRAQGDLVILDVATQDDSRAYATANLRILDDAQAHASAAHADVVVTVVWDGHSRGEDDLTAAFGLEAHQRGLRVLEVPTR